MNKNYSNLHENFSDFGNNMERLFLKHPVVLPPLITQDSWFLSKTFTNLANLLPIPYLSNIEIRNE